jgi:hypothetical protein
MYFFDEVYYALRVINHFILCAKVVLGASYQPQTWVLKDLSGKSTFDASSGCDTSDSDSKAIIYKRSISAESV